VRENDFVHKGDLLLQIDPQPYRLALEHAAADLDVAQAALGAQRRVVSTQKSGASVASEQIRRAQTNAELAARTEERLRPLTAKGYVPLQQLDQAEVAQRDAATSLRQAREQARAARNSVGTVDGATAAVRAATVALALAQRALEDTTVRASHDGRIVGLTVSTGEMLVPAQSVFTLINTEEWFANANLRETDLHEVAVGSCATVYSMLDRSKPIKGVVDGVGWGVLSDDRINVPRSVPYVAASLNWVRVARRFPVRIRLEHPAPELVRLGASASVEFGHGAACP
jgi:multidrug efflux system membrane fusion protein